MNPERKQVVFIDVSKAVAALCVSLYHFIYHADHTGALIEGHAAALTAFTDFLWSTVFIFFVISGYAIVGHLKSARYKLADLPTFLAKRMIRIYFPFLLCMLSYVLLEIFFNWCNHRPQEVHWRQFFSNLTFSAEFTGEKWYNTVFWTLAIEIQFYILIAFAYPLFRFLVSKKLFPLILLCCLGMPFLIPASSLIFVYLPLLCIGYTLFLERNGAISRILALVSMACCAVVSSFCFESILIGCILTLFSLLFIFIRNWKAGTIATYFSRMTYSYYLFHGISGGTFLYFTARYAHSNGVAVLLIIAALLVSTVVAHLAFVVIERPSVGWSKRWVKYKGARK